MTDEQTGTRERVLDAASVLFAEKGFGGSSVAEICRQARANIAAVNYHFGSKENLYREAWRHAHFSMLGQCPPDGGVGSEAPAVERLRGRIRAMLQRALLDEGLEFRIMGHEIANPTGLLHQVIRDTIRPLREAMTDIVRELLGGAAEERTVRLCVMSIIGPCLQVMRRRRMQIRTGEAVWFGADMLEEMVEHFTTFALAGISQIRRRAENAGLQEQEGSRGGTTTE